VHALERDVFGTGDAAALVDEFCRERLGAGVERSEFHASGVGSVHGVRLADGRRVVVKAYRGDADRAHLAAVQAVQARLAEKGFPAPAPLLAPAPLARGVAVVESLLVAGGPVDPHGAAGRRAVAAGLTRLVREARPAPGLRSLGAAAAELWRRPHDARFDFAATAAGAEWIDRLAGEARRRLHELDAGEDVVGHADWRVEHLRFDGDELAAVYDWDSLAAGPEPWFAGGAAHAFTADWSRDDMRLPSLDEALAFLHEYERARGRPFTQDERRAAELALVASTAYGARCEHSDRCTAMGTRPAVAAPATVPAGGYLGFLAQHGPALLGVSAEGVPRVT
jgi:hypothetical protein